MNLLYSAVAALLLLVTSPVWLLGILLRGRYREGAGERLGRVPPRLGLPSQRPAIWVHAVSVGEVLAVSGVIEELRRRFPGHRVLVSTTTATGQKLARERFGAENAFYFPLDFAFAVRRYLRALRPELVVVAETEFWPNFLGLAHASGARIAVVNARISDRSFPRYRRFRSLMRPVLRNVDLFLAQTEEDRRRLLQIGAPADRAQVSGNLKFDLSPTAAAPLTASLRSALERDGGAPVLVCGSTVEGEEDILLDAFQALRRRSPSTVMILAPRRPERFQQVAETVASSGMPLRRGSQWDASQPLAGSVFLLDSIGELASVYALAHVAFVGGSLVPRGGHNILEAAQHGAAIVVGPHTENFREITQIFCQADALIISPTEQFKSTLLNLLADDSRRRELGQRAAEVLRRHQGAVDRTIAALEPLLAADDGRDPVPQSISSRLEA